MKKVTERRGKTRKQLPEDLTKKRG